MSNPYKILVKLPSRGRVDRFFRSLDSIVSNAYNIDLVEINCTLDFDDPIMNNPETIEKIRRYPNTSISWGKSESKIHAINRDVPDSEWDILVLTSDDIFFNMYGFDEYIRVEMGQHFPLGDGYLHFMEKDTKEVLNVMPIMDKKYYQRFGYIYHPSYISLWADNEQTEVAKILNKYAYVPYQIMLHRNPAYSYSDCPKDEMFEKQQSFWAVDEANFNKRKALNFEL